MQKLRQKAHDALRKSERFFKTDMVYLAKGGFWLLVGQVAGSLSALLLAICFANFVPKEIYGNYKYVLSLMTVLGALSLSGLSSAVLRAATRGLDGTLRRGFAENIRWSAAIVAGALAASLYYLFQHNLNLSLSFFIVALLLPIFNGTQLYASYLNGKKSFRTLSLIGLWQDFMPVVALVATMFFTSNVVFLVMAYLVSNTVVSLALYIHTIASIPKDSPVDHESLKLSRHLSLINIIAVIGDKIDSILLFHFLGGVPLAVYTFATAIPNQIIGVLKNVTTLTVPKFAQRDKDETRKSIHTKFFTFLIGVIPITIIYMLSAPHIYKALFPLYIESTPYSQLYSLIFLISAGMFYTAFLEAHLAIREKYVMTIVSNILRVILMATLVVPFGINGIIWAQLATKTVMVSISAILIYKVR